MLKPVRFLDGCKMTFEPLKNKLVDKYPEDIFIEPTKEQWEKIHELCNKEIGKPFDGFAGSISRHVLRNCIEDVKSAVNGLKQEIESRKIPIEKLPDKKTIVSDTKEKFVSDFNQEIDDIIKTINKWFEDVI